VESGERVEARNKDGGRREEPKKREGDGARRR
jgi:hypothetical protein